MKKNILLLLLLMTCMGCATVEQANGVKKIVKPINIGDKYLYSYQWNEQQYHPIPIDTITVIDTILKNGSLTCKYKNVLIYPSVETFRKNIRPIK